jgi:serine protease inhibitor
MGLTLIFSDEANLSGITKERLYVSRVVQKAEIEVDEEGATATAATGSITTRTSFMYIARAEFYKGGLVKGYLSPHFL